MARDGRSSAGQSSGPGRVSLCAAGFLPGFSYFRGILYNSRMPQPLKIFKGKSVKWGVTLTSNHVARNVSTATSIKAVICTGDNRRLLMGPVTCLSNDTLADGTAASWSTGFVVIPWSASDTVTTEFTGMARLQIDVDGNVAESDAGAVQIKEAHT